MTALSHLEKMGGTKSKEIYQISKEIQEYVIVNGITLTAEQFPRSQNVNVSWESRHIKDARKLCPQTTQDNSNNGPAKRKPFLVTLVTPTSMVYVMKAGPVFHSCECPTTKKDTYDLLCFVLTFTNRESLRSQSY